MSGHDPEQRLIETFQFRGWLADAAQQQEFARADSMVRYLHLILLCPYLPQDECFEAVYGPDGARVFWEVQCSEPIKLRHFVDLLAVTGATDKARYDPLSAALWAAMLAAFQAGERTWFVGDTTPFEGADYGWQVMKAKGADKLKVRARDAAEWLLRMPKRRHLVPEWLAAVLRPVVQPHPIRAPEADRNTRGERPRGTEQALTTWFEKRVAAWPDGQKAPSEEKDWAEARENFAPGLTREKFRNGRAIATPEAWRKRGQRRPWGEAKLLNPP
jgi:hypothetical protein